MEGAESYLKKGAEWTGKKRITRNGSRRGIPHPAAPTRNDKIREGTTFGRRGRLTFLSRNAWGTQQKKRVKRREEEGNCTVRTIGKKWTK